MMRSRFTTSALFAILLAACFEPAAAAGAAPLPPPTVASPDTLDLLLLGDSITEGQGAFPGFRDDLHDLLAAEPAHHYRFVGSTGSPPLQGHFMGGKQVQDFYPPGFGNGWGNGKFDTTPDLGPPGTPDIAAIHLGTNDLNSDPPPYVPYSLDHGQTLHVSQAGELAEFLEFLLQWQDGTRSSDLNAIVLSTIIPMQGRAQDVKDRRDAVIAMSEDFGEGIPTGTPVRIAIADHYGRFITNPNLFTFGPGDWMSDALHPNNAGYIQMADVYHQAIVSATNDTVPPAAVTDLAVAVADSGRVVLTLTAPGGDGSSGRASWYDVRRSTGPIDSQSFGFAAQAFDEPAPRPAGAADTVIVNGLLPGTTYAFALKAVDGGGNRAAISNVVVATTTGSTTVILTLRDGVNGYAGTGDDAIIDGRPIDNWGSGVQIGIGRQGSGDVFRTLIRFDLSAIPAGVEILDAKLSAYHFQRNSTADVPVGAYRVTKHWVEGTRSTVPQQQTGSACWIAARYQQLNWSAPGASAANDNAMNGDPNYDRYATPEATATVQNIGTWVEWNLTRAVGEWVSGAWDNEGVILQALTEGTNTRRLFHSAEYPDNQLLRPTLVVTFSVPPSNQAPVADVGGPYAGLVGEAIQFDGTGSFDPEGQGLTYLWDFGDGQTGTGPTPAHTYTEPGIYAVNLVVDDGFLGSDPDETTATIQGVSAAGEPTLVTRLLGAFPNPFARSTAIQYDLAAPGRVRLTIYDPSGRLVRVLVDQVLGGGRHQSAWDGRSWNGTQVGRGVYFYRLVAPGLEASEKLLLAR